VNPPEVTKKLLTHYLRRLTNLSGNNRSLFLGRLSSEQFLDLHEVSQLNREKSFSIVESIIAGKKKIICPVVDARMEESNEVSKKLKKLQRLEHFLFEERGSKDLHLGWPFVRGKLSDGTCVQCPLLFFPVELEQENQHWVIRPRPEADITFNKTFLLAYAFYNKVKVDEALLDENFEETDRDSTVFRTAIYQLLNKGALGIHFNPDNYRDELTSFTAFTKNKFEEQHKNGELKLFPEAVLGIFPQAGSYLVPDYVDLIENKRIIDLEDFFQSRHAAEETGSTNFITQVKEEKVYSSFPMDIWQENALKAVKLGNSIVVQGPPGTGKSQLICNLISDGISHRKRIMVVCQKRAALDVVYARLTEKKLSSFVGLVHDFKNDRNAIYKKIALQIEHVDDNKAKNNSLDTIQLERTFYQASRRIDQVTDELEEFKHALFDESEAGTSIKELYLRSSPDAPSVNLKQEYQYLRAEAVPLFLTKLKFYTFYAERFEQETWYPWRERKSFSSYQARDLKTLLGHLKEIPRYFEGILSQLHELSAADLTFEECETLVNRKKEAEELIELLGTEQRFKTFQTIVLEPEEETSSLWLANIERVIGDCYQGEGPEISVAPHHLGQLMKALQRSLKARRNLIGLVAWELFSRDKIFITRVLLANGLKSNKAGLLALERKLDNRLNLEHNFSKLRTKKWLTTIPEGYNLVAIQHWTQDFQRAIRAKEIYHSIRGLKNMADPSRLRWQEFHSRMGILFKLFEEIPLRKAIWLNYFTPTQLTLLTQPNPPLEELEATLKNDFDALVEFDRQNESLTPDEKSIIKRLFQSAGTWDYPQLERLFLNSWCLAWIDHTETKHPVLSIVSSGKLHLLEIELREQIALKQQISNEILLLRAHEAVTDNLEFNRLNNLVTYRDLYHQVTKKKKIWPLRKVVSEFEDELFRVVPCWLVSPESVSTIFPMKEMFDLVIFDEASQCFAERGIPAMYRAKQVVVAGDDQQLRPSDLYQARWQEEEPDHPDLEMDSLLELCTRYLLSVDLRSHYRSQSLALIDFSNQHFYQGRLQLLPDRNAANRAEPPIEYIKLSGTWAGNTNLAEAEKIVELVMGLIRDHPRKSVGIVTFNASQQSLILDLLEEKSAALGRILPESLFIKNIENVQGDEKDIIIFSIAYAPDKQGKLSVQFGSLNQQGGENRLNVAITRAREKIIVVTSILPDELHVEDTAHPGPKLLKAYLQYARAVSLKNFKPFVASETMHSLQWYLKRKIKELGQSKFTAATIEVDHFPFADVTVLQNDEYAGIILTDDENYFKSLSAKERHATLPELLEQKNWKYLSQYSRHYWQDAEKFINEVGKFVTP
jgi:hypothetical protein